MNRSLFILASAIFILLQSCMPPMRAVTGRMPESTGSPGSGAVDLGVAYEVPINSDPEKPHFMLEPQIFFSVHENVDIDFNVMMHYVGIDQFAHSWLGSFGAHYRIVHNESHKFSIGGGLMIGAVDYGGSYEDDEENEDDDEENRSDWGIAWGTFFQFDYGYRINKNFGIYLGNNINFALAGSAPAVLFGVHGMGFQINWNKNLYSSMEFAIVWQALDGAPPFSLGPAITLIGYNW